MSRLGQRPHILAAAALVLAAAQCLAGQVRIVVLKNGNRVSVSRAWLDGATYHLELEKGGMIAIPAELVKRVSSDSTDVLAADRPLVVAQSSGLAGAGGRPAEPESYDAPPIEPELMTAAGMASGPPTIRPGMPPHPAPQQLPPGAAVEPTMGNRPANGFRGRELTPKPGMMNKLLARPSTGNGANLEPADR